MNCHVLGIVHVVDAMVEMAAFLEEKLALPAVEHGPQSVLFDNGSVSLRLVAATSSLPADEHDLVLDVAAIELEETVEELLEDSRLRKGESFWLTPTRKAVRLFTPWTLTLLVGRTFDEDELGIVVQLKTELVWDELAVSAVQNLAVRVPVAFRGQLRTKTVARAEALAMQRGVVEVDQATALSALIQVTPEFQLENLRQGLRINGFDPSLFAEDFLR